MGIRPRELNKLFRTDTRRYADKLVILQPLSFQNDESWRLHRVLRAVDNNLLISQLPPEEVAGTDECFIPRSSCWSISRSIRTSCATLYG